MRGRPWDKRSVRRPGGSTLACLVAGSQAQDTSAVGISITQLTFLKPSQQNRDPTETRESGGTGRRAGFRSQWLHCRGGSSPPFRTIPSLLNDLIQRLSRLVGNLIGAVEAAPWNEHIRCDADHFVSAVGAEPRAIGQREAGAGVFQRG